MTDDDQQRTVPYSGNTELAVIGAVTVWADRVLEPVLAIGLAPDDFYVPAHQRAWAAILKITSAGRPLDHHVLAAELGGKRTVADAIAVAGQDGPGNAVEWARVVLRYARARQALHHLRDATAAAYELDLTQTVESLQAALAAAGAGTA